MKTKIINKYIIEGNVETGSRVGITGPYFLRRYRPQMADQRQILIKYKLLFTVIRKTDREYPCDVAFWART